MAGILFTLVAVVLVCVGTAAKIQRRKFMDWRRRFVALYLHPYIDIPNARLYDYYTQEMTPAQAVHLVEESLEISHKPSRAWVRPQAPLVVSGCIQFIHEDLRVKWDDIAHMCTDDPKLTAAAKLHALRLRQSTPDGEGDPVLDIKRNIVVTAQGYEIGTYV